MEAYRASIEPFGSGSASGTAVVLVAPSLSLPGDGALFYGGSVSGLAPNLDALDCPATNGCGVHVHSGKGCGDLLEQEGHHYDKEGGGFVLDPWRSAKYSSDGEGRSVFDGFVAVGAGKAGDLAGRAFVVHAEDGSRVGCGLLEPVADGTLAASLTGIQMSGKVYAVGAGDDALCFAGTASGLSVDRGCDPVRTPNSCGTHVHSGTSCAGGKYVQGGHWYDLSTAGEGEDPWRTVGYPATDEAGTATFGRCVATGFPAGGALDKPFVVHEKDGGRVLCGMLEAYAGGEARHPYGAASLAAAVALATIGAGGIMFLVCACWRRRKSARQSAAGRQSDLELSGGTGRSEFRDEDPLTAKSGGDGDGDGPELEIT